MRLYGPRCLHLVLCTFQWDEALIDIHIVSIIDQRNKKNENYWRRRSRWNSFNLRTCPNFTFHLIITVYDSNGEKKENMNYFSIKRFISFHRLNFIFPFVLIASRCRMLFAIIQKKQKKLTESNNIIMTSNIEMTFIPI